MAAIDAATVSREQLIEIAKTAAIAALGAPQVTKGKTEIKASIIHEPEDLEIICHGVHILCGPDGRLNTYMYGDYVNLRRSLDEGNPMVLLVVGGNAHLSNLGWDCGACGFLTCADYNKFARAHGIGPGTAAMGPNCMWKLQDCGIAQMYAAAKLYEHHIPTRPHTSYGAMGLRFGFITGTTSQIGMSLGPAGGKEWDVHYNRPMLKNTFANDDIWGDFKTICANMFVGFSGRGKPAVKYAPNWFAPPMKYIREVEDPAYDTARRESNMALAAYVAEVAAKRAEKEGQK